VAKDLLRRHDTEPLRSKYAHFCFEPCSAQCLQPSLPCEFLLKLGTSGVAGSDLVTVAVGLKAILNDHMEIGAAYERPVSQPRDLIDNRVLAEFILRF
jgi:hypothetical protein